MTTLTTHQLLERTILCTMRTLRESHKYSQETVAAELGINQNTYSKIETGRTAITVKDYHNSALYTALTFAPFSTVPPKSSPRLKPASHPKLSNTLPLTVMTTYKTTTTKNEKLLASLTRLFDTAPPEQLRETLLHMYHVYIMREYEALSINFDHMAIEMYMLFDALKEMNYILNNMETFEDI